MVHSGVPWRLGRRPSLDGLRGLAVLLVVLCHLSLTRTLLFAASGPVGVTVFFTLSGFLITTLLLEERARDGGISLRGFYARRIRRLLPALVVFVAGAAAVATTAGPSIATRRDVVASLLYVGNWLPARSDYMGALNHTWSLAIEEQFYLVWPVLVIVVLRRSSERALAVVALVGAGTSLIARFALWDSGHGADRIYYGSDTRADALLLGCALAVWMRGRGAGASNPRVAHLMVAGVGILALVSHPLPRYLILPTVVALATMVAIATLTRGRYSGWLEARPLVWLGRRSYGLYLWHLLVLMTVEAWDVPWPVTMVTVVALSLMLTELSWRYVEQPLLHPRAEAITVGRPSEEGAFPAFPAPREEDGLGDVAVGEPRRGGDHAGRS